MEPPGLGLGLDDRVTVGLESANPDLFSVELDFCLAAFGLAQGLGFDSEYTGRADQHMVQIEPLPNDVMEHLVAIFPQPLQKLAYYLLAVAGLP